MDVNEYHELKDRVRATPGYTIVSSRLSYSQNGQEGRQPHYRVRVLRQADHVGIEIQNLNDWLALVGGSKD